MTYKEALTRYKPILIIILLLSVVFLVRADAVNLSGLTEEQKVFYQDQNGLPYFSEMDSYYNYRLTENFINTGIMGDTIQDGVVWDLHSYAPPGRAVTYPPLIVYITAFFYYLANLFAETPLMEVAFWTGAIIASLCVIPAYLLVRRITNDYGGIAAAILVGLAIPYFAHSYAGFFDTDMFNMLFPLLIIYFFVLSIQASNTKNRIIFAAASAVSLLLFSLAWVGYIFYLLLLVAVVITYLIAAKLILKPDPKSVKEYSSKLDWLLDQKELFSFLAFLVVGIILIGIFNGFSTITTSITDLVGASSIQAVTQATNYPNIYVSVGELQVAPWLYAEYGIGTLLLPNNNTVIGGVGGLIVFLCGILGIGTLIWKMRTKITSRRTKIKNKKPPKSQRKRIDNRTTKETEETPKSPVTRKDVFKIKRESLFYVVLFTVWLIATAFTTTKGSRFIALFALPVGLCAGIFIGFAVDYIKENFNTASSLGLIAFIAGTLAAFPLTALFGLSSVFALLAGIVAGAIVLFIKSTHMRAVVVTIVLVLAIISPAVSISYNAAQSVVPGTNDDMFNSMEWVKKNTDNDTILISWWDFGHLFTAIGDRGATFDGGTQNTPRAYWVGKAMLTSNESLSKGIFNMLASSGDTAYLTLENYTKDTGKSTQILTDTLGVSKEEALNIMVNKYGLTTQQAQNVIKYSHPDNPRPFVFVGSSDMLSKASVWSYFGSWNFTDNNGTSSSYYSAVSAQPINGTNTTVALFDIALSSNQVLGVIINNTSSGVNASLVSFEMAGSENGSISLNLSSNTTIPTHKLTVLSMNDNSTTIQEGIVDPDGNNSLILYTVNGQVVQVYGMSRSLEDSMFTKLFLLFGYNQTSFELVNATSTVKLFRPT